MRIKPPCTDVAVATAAAAMFTMFPPEVLLLLALLLSDSERMRFRNTCKRHRLVIDTDPRCAFALNEIQSIAYLECNGTGLGFPVRSLNLSYSILRYSNMHSNIIDKLSACNSPKTLTLYELNLSFCDALEDISPLRECSELHGFRL